MIVPKLSSYMIQEMFKDGTFQRSSWFSEACWSPEEAVLEYLKYFMPSERVFLVTDVVSEAEHYVQATYGWNCEKICKPKKEL